MAGRADVAERIAALVGADVLRITDPGSGWPAFGELLVEGTWVPVALFVAPVGLSHRDRDEVERRFQNPGGNRPITETPGRAALLLGLWEDDELLPVDRPLLVSADFAQRLGRTTRFSVFVGVALLQAALGTGWSQGQNAVGEPIRCFVPPLLPLSFVADRDAAAPPTPGMRAAIRGAGLLEAINEETPAAAERARRAASILVRDARFSRRVVEAYQGSCAMCGLDIGLVQGAHIYPAAASGSQDEPWNGLALCANHHLAFDKHLIGVDPTSWDIRLHPDIEEQATKSPAAGAFIEGTFPQLAIPDNPSARPREQMLHLRYDLFVDEYGWIFEA